MKEKLKPCPFCGGKPHIEYSPVNYWRFYHTCKGYKPYVKIYSSGYISESDTIETWNRRIEDERM